MKDEKDLKSCKTFDDVKNLIKEYIYYYNNERPQWNLAKLAPSEYYEFNITGVNPR